MYRTIKIGKTDISRNTSVQGEPLERKLERIIENKEEITDTIPVIYTERHQGVLAETNIRTDRFEVAIDGTDKIDKSYKARREERGKTEEIKNDDKVEPIYGTEE